MNDEQRDPKEEMDNAMIPFRENGTQILPKNWDCDMLAIVLRDNSFEVELDSDMQVIANTGLIQAPDGSLWRFTPDA